MLSQRDKEFRGLSDAEVKASRSAHGYNRIEVRHKSPFLLLLKGLIHEPMILLLILAAILYFIAGDQGDALFMLAAILLVGGISIFQDNRSRKAIDKLKSFIQPEYTVIRNGARMKIHPDEIVMDDLVMISEGTIIPVDGLIMSGNDFSVNESVLTGEALPVYKNEQAESNQVFSGTLVESGLAIIRTTAIGNNTSLGRISSSLHEVAESKTPLEVQISDFVRKMVIIGLIVFLIVWAINYFRSQLLLDSLLKALTLAMSILPEEIPVAFSTFMAMGAWKLMKLGIVVKQMKTVETLGSATVICTDKTGTLTENKMSLAEVYLYPLDQVRHLNEQPDPEVLKLVRVAMWASEPIPFDPMEKDLHRLYGEWAGDDERLQFKMFHEYPLGGTPPMMTHIYQNKEGTRIIAAKGAPEAMINVSGLDQAEKDKIQQALNQFASQGYRVLGVAAGSWAAEWFPATQQELPFTFQGLLAFSDLPKPNMKQVLDDFYNAGIDVKIVTGDNAITTAAIARMIGFRGADKAIDAREIAEMPQEQRNKVVRDYEIFSRMYPEAKLKMIEALKSDRQVVAMLGDGVNDGPALKAAHIGVAMGKKGTEIARQAAALVLVNDDLSQLVHAIRYGRHIYANLKKAIQYIISIHIPIILTVFIPLALNWLYPNIFTPVHVIFLELIMGPTCSIIYENEPIETNLMTEKPRPFTETFFNLHELTTSIIQGLMITGGTIGIYLYAVGQGYSEDLTRTMVFITLISANIFLTLINRSFYYSIFTTLSYKNYLIPLIIGLTVIITALLLYVDPLTAFFKFQHPGPAQLGLAIATGFVCTMWFEIFKWKKRMKMPDNRER